MSRVKTVVLPKIGSVQLIIKTKREIRAHPAYAKMESDSNEWLYWNRVWHSEVALSEWLIQEFYPDKLMGKKILELGCGTGLAGIVCAGLGGVPTFSDIVPMVMDTVKETCKLNGIVDYHTLILDWSHPESLLGTFNLVLGSEIFYDNSFLNEISALLEHALPVGERGLFCDPNRLGFETVEESFSKNFTLTVIPRTVNWPPMVSGKVHKKQVYLYELVKSSEV